MINIEKVTLDQNIVSKLIELSKIWEEENITFGYHANTKDDLKEPCYIAVLDNEVIGYVFGHYYENTKIIANIGIGDKCFEVDEIYVLKEFRSRGIGKMLFKALEREVSQEAMWITLPTSTKDYKKILKFYNEDVGLTFHSAFLFKKMK